MRCHPCAQGVTGKQTCRVEEIVLFTSTHFKVLFHLFSSHLSHPRCYNLVNMRSPLPDSSPLEASLIADQPSPLRNTCVQDSVRSLLRVSMLCRPGHSSRVDEEETIQVFSDVHFDSELDWQAESYMNASRSPTTGPHSTPQDVQPSFTNNNNDSTVCLTYQTLKKQRIINCIAGQYPR